ncbi:hypothetical protein L202_06987 [Cryptococcus amylolentus CBS 6039]|uniref:SCP domain-containing protein n=1 Tax=Cryptococcus amylolentus CBS 6039 TaxID=1295533 RepID=A0A1E3HGU7_9TREE|nr:hypothetical protein L202_06987 [Cryptococcus amylolentus CBS 6039]ODN74641.1 hypothetical protein L202_06987 [Cryptococcus amylolentus CBS 6039]
MLSVVMFLVAIHGIGLGWGKAIELGANDQQHSPEARWITQSYRVGESFTYDSDMLAITKISEASTVSPIIVTSTLYISVYAGTTDESAHPTASSKDNDEGVVAVAISTSSGATSLIDVSFTDSHVTPPSTASTNTHSSASSTSSATADSQTWVDAHNKPRNQYGAANLVWDDQLAVVAQQHAKLCNKEHTKAAENLQWGSAKYNWNKPGYSEATGHFTQLVWKDTKRVGCYIARCPQGSVVDEKYTTSFQTACEYDPAGNYVNEGEFAQNVGTIVS